MPSVTVPWLTSHLARPSMAVMQSGKARPRWGRVSTRILLAAVLAGLWSPWPGATQQWDPGTAEAALNQARALKKKLDADQSAGTSDYLRCIRLYRRVYMSDPHFEGSDDAIYEAASLYQEMAARFRDPAYDLEAVQLLRFLIKDYPASPFKPYAILRLAAIGPAREVMSETASGFPPPPQVPEKAVQPQLSAGSAPPRSEGAPAGAPAAAVRSIHYRSEAEYTHVTIDFDEPASYQGQRLSNPDRFFLDFSNTWLVLETSDSIVPVNDRYLRRVRAAQYQPGIVRIVLDLRPGADCTVSETRNPFRIVVDIRGGQSPVSPKN